MWKTGHSLIKAKMAETGALLAGEMSGHIFFKERWFGFDDGIYSAARLLEIVGSETVDSETLFEAFPDDISTPELNVNVTEDNKFSLIEQLKQRADFNGADVSTIDGIRADFENGWGLVRASNTTPVLVLRFGAEDETVLSDIQAHFKRELLAIAPELEIPF
jgi:phosphomannomutase/phosphoglucomutase